jgi:cyd operon protein YbgT
MWYFAWILGVSLACFFGILNGMWFEMREDARKGVAPDPQTQGNPAPGAAPDEL